MRFPSDIFVDQYKAAAAEGAVVELKLRLLADKIPALQKYAHEKSIANIELEVAQHFANFLSEEDNKTLSLCRQLRNKIFHANFSEARSKLVALGGRAQRGGVIKVGSSGLSSIKPAEKITNAISGVEGTFEYIADTETSKPGSIFGWLLEITESGDLLQSIDAFKKAVAIIDRLMVEAVSYT